MGTFKSGIIKFLIKIRRYCRLGAGLRIWFATRESFRTAPVQTGVKKKWNKGRGWYALDPSAFAAGRHRRGTLDRVVIAEFSVFRNPNFLTGGQVAYGEEQRVLTPPLISTGSNTLRLDKVSTEDGCNFVPRLYGFLIGHGIRPSLVLKSIFAHLLAECWRMYPGQQLTSDKI